MDIWEGDKLILFLAFVIPGFISLKAYQLVFPATERSSQDQLIDAIAYSSINYSILLLPILSVEASGIKENHPALYCFFYIFVFFLAPIIWVLIWRRLRISDFFQKAAIHPVQKPWDYVFAQRKCYWVRVTLKNGKVLGGEFAEASFASSSPAPEQLYLEKTWFLNEDGSFERQKNSSAGILILSSEISHVELTEYDTREETDS
ncbi:DUF6338 family protein [Marinomonas sp. FW-1]|uniref:DUF6338 family protein n=1 Tax=Marinomonas sp. FW-1 TaxID=2071621 RepID=UPI0010C0828F|nr:DUF6338 family protein [Marinomonas sp. FW-1]